MNGARQFLTDGTALLLAAVDRMPDPELDRPSRLPGWSRRHVLAHLAANADALRRLVSWARTGREQRMYASREQRDAEIEQGSALPADRLRDWLVDSSRRLAADLAELDEPAWRAEVVTAQGRTVPATEIPWLRAREVYVHAVDLDAGVGFADLPTDFLTRLTDEVVAKRSDGTGPAATLRAVDTGGTWEIAGTGAPAPVEASLAELAAWLTGRAVTTADGGRLPELSPWL